MKIFSVVFIIFAALSVIQAQDEYVDVFVIDSYVTMEKPYTFVISFFTTSPALSKVEIADKYEFVVSDTLTEDHKIEVNLNDYQFDSKYVQYVIFGTTENGTKFQSDTNEVVLPFKDALKTDKGTSLLTVCCFGGVIFGLPSAVYVQQNGKDFFSITKEIPVFSFYSGGYNYPFGYVSLEYSHIFNAEFRNFLRLGYKQVFEVEPIEFISGGISGFTSFEGFNGFSPEFTIGWFKVYNTFTFYSRYRYNFQPTFSERDFHEFSIGLYSNFFSINF